ncbi:hypothetical protein ACA910_021678 [Epithemia clementina (nom. ined.)]
MPQNGNGSSISGDARIPNPKDGRPLLGQYPKQKSGSVSSRSTLSDESTTKSASQQLSKRTVMKAVRSRSKQSLTEGLSQSVPNLNHSALDDCDVDSNSTFSAISESVWSPVSEPKIKALIGEKKINLVRPLDPNSSNGSLQGVTIQTTAPAGSVSGKTTKIRASELGIKISKDTSAKEVEEAVRRWKSEQKSKEILSGGRLVQHIKTAGSEYRAHVAEEGKVANNSADPDENDSQQRNTRKVIVRRATSVPGASGSGNQLKRDETNDGKAQNVAEGVKTGGKHSSESYKLQTEVTPLKPNEAATTSDAKRVSRRPRSVSPAINRDPSNKPQQQPKRAATPGKPKPRTQTPSRVMTPSRRRRSSIGGSPKGRDLSKSPARGADYRPVSWRPEDSSMHKESSEASNKLRGGARPASRPRTVVDEHGEIQKRLREAGISLEQYRAMLGAGLTVGLA